ncbi:virion structural protein [Pseudomonas phage Phabio]|uniref:Virion structural protein n=1 Tax=Pseudomonas phage Phabio TaxID=2006668 RepID=A0A1Y0STL5_9CAUD|nr:virion structural protein [Pseudomonas phage Phabio]ARV76831.1 virion structural protein [Pseudomonas phage Phabio]
MSSVYFDVYRADTIKLVRSVVIKFSPIATQMNLWIARDLKVIADEDAPETWKYYMNMNGEYHVTDQMMYVRSADTLETIEFTKENLLYHRATAREYAPGSVMYENLVRQYPDQSALINGILHPIDIDRAINAPDGQILYYDESLVEAHEDTFLYDLQDWITVYIIRWWNPNFALTDEMYLPAFWGNLFITLVPGIMNLRLAQAKTNRAHSYHIREYLASHGHLDDYLPYLDTRQRLWLYRNINFIQRNAGKKDTFDRLVKNILTPRGIPLIRYTLEQNSKDILTNFRPSVELEKHDINRNIVVEGLNKISVEELLDREEDLARDNIAVKHDSEQWITDKMSMSAYSSLSTRVLDSEVIDRSNSNVRTLMNCLLNEWLQLASTDKYRAYVTLNNPRTGEQMTVSVKDAYIITIYCWMKARDQLSEFIPSCTAYEVLLPKLPTFEELRWMSPKRIIPNKIITAIQDLFEPMTNYISTENFYHATATMHQNYLKQWELYSLQENMIGRGYCEQITKMHYMNRMCKLVEGNITWDDYFKTLGFSLKDLTEIELEQLCVDTVNIATGANLVRVITIGEIQRELLKMMEGLCSYPLQFLRNVAYTNFNVLGMVMPRIGDISVDGSGNLIVPAVNIGVKRVSSSASSLILVNDVIVGPEVSYHYDQYGRWRINCCVDIRETSFNNGNYIIPAGNIGLVGYKAENLINPDPSGNLDQYQPIPENDKPEFEAP